MSKPAATLVRIEGHESLWTVQRGNLRCNVVGLEGGGTCLYSPVEKTSGVAAEAAPIRFLLAPNHYHNKAVPEHIGAYPHAKPVCSENARPRLEKITGTPFGSLSALAEALPDHITLLEPDGLKTGEVWLRVKGDGGVAWVVTDAFCGVSDKNTPEPALGFLKTFPKYGLADKEMFSAWVQECLEHETPNMIIPCHGGIARGTDLKADILGLLETL
ncbi:hypothetical protein [uncultured Roseibium sp.]|uniref:hypothetical protein n=1 Tax=uncultured Roseibium sp. TaxID=1936171 RepID=UPI0026152E10|nr:hypothetical protein [uncultured Roseibium sp.]